VQSTIDSYPKKRVGNGELDQKNSDFATHLQSYIKFLPQTKVTVTLKAGTQFCGYRTLRGSDCGEKVRK
jgi:hypothetical protein